MGFDLVGFTSALPPSHLDIYEDWLKQGYGGTMHYLERHAPLKADISTLLPAVQSLIVVACNYYWPSPSESDFKVARYAQGEDYHSLMKHLLNTLAERIQKQEPHLEYRAFVDSGPLLEKELAQRAGLGWIGKHTNLIHPRHGSWFLLGCLLTNLDLPWDPPFDMFHCGTCTRCIEACPTQAILAPHTLDARRCISYLTIEWKGEIPCELREPIGQHIFGCDICQEVCPWNQKFQQPTRIPGFFPREWLQTHTLADLLGLTEQDFAHLIAPLSPFKRPKYHGFMRNLLVAAGNSKDTNLRPILKHLQQQPLTPLLHIHLEWALSQV